MKIIIKDNILFDIQTQTVFTEFYLELEKYYFPSNNWTDFVYPVISWWADEIILKNNTDENMKFIFMDGSYNFKCKIADNLMHCDFYIDDYDLIPTKFNQYKSKDDTYMFSDVLNYQKFILEIKSSLEKCISFFETNLAENKITIANRKKHQKEIETCKNKIKKLELILSQLHTNTTN